MKEAIPKEVVHFLDETDVELDPISPPQFSYEQCGGEMYPEYYKNLSGIEFKISDLDHLNTED